MKKILAFCIVTLFVGSGLMGFIGNADADNVKEKEQQGTDTVAIKDLTQDINQEKYNADSNLPDNHYSPQDMPKHPPNYPVDNLPYQKSSFHSQSFEPEKKPLYHLPSDISSLDYQKHSFYNYPHFYPFEHDVPSSYSNKNIISHDFVQSSKNLPKNLTSHDPIYINGNSDFTEANGVTGGNGTESNPYIIENWDINASSANGIDVRNTNAYFVIRNCYMHDGWTGNWDKSYDGMRLYNALNGTIEHCMHSNNLYGVVLLYSSNSIITNCTFYKNQNGVYFKESSNNQIINCSICDSYYDSIHLWSSSNNNISNNTVSGCPDDGISFYESNNNTLTKNNISNNYYGICVYHSSNNTVKDCHINSNDGMGFYFYDISWSEISNCTMLNNRYGMYTSSSSNNSILHNNISFNRYGNIMLAGSTHNIFTNNQMWSKDGNLRIYGYEKEHFNNTISPSNIINGLPIYYYYDLHDDLVKDLYSTYIFLAHCVNITVENCTISNGDGMYLAYTNISVIRTCILSNNYYYGIYLWQSSNNTITDCYISNNEDGVTLYESSNNTIKNNSIIGNAVYAVDIYDDLCVNAQHNYFGTSDSDQISKLFWGNVDYSNWLSYKETDVQYINETTEWRNTSVNINNGLIVNENLTLNNVTLVFNSSNGRNFIQINNNLTIIDTIVRCNYGEYTIIYLNHTSGIVVNANIKGQKAVTFQADKINISNSTIYDGRYGLILMASSNNTIADCNISDNYMGVIFWLSSNSSSISNCTISNNSYSSLYLYGSSYNNMRCCHILDNSIGIVLGLSSDNTITNCHIHSNNDYGIAIYDASGNVVSNTNISNNYYGIEIWGWSGNATNNSILSCNISDNEYGISIYSSSNNTFRNNTLWNNSWNFNLCEYYNSEGYYQDIDTTNTINGAPVYYLVGKSNELFDFSNATVGYFGLVNCDNITAKNLTTAYNKEGLLIVYTTNSSIENSSFLNNYVYGIYIKDSTNNTILNCNVSSSYYGIYMAGYSKDNHIINCTISNIKYGGIYFYEVSNNTISSCNVYSNGGPGIYLYSSSSNLFIGCNISNNSDAIFAYNSSGNSIINCDISYNSYYGIELITFSNNTRITNSTLLNNYGYAIRLWSVSNTIIENCTISNNFYSGIYVRESLNNVIRNCSIFNHLYYGMYISSSENNTMYHNNFINNTHQAYDYGANYWDNGMDEGNYWSDFDESSEGAYDNNTDGIVDTPYAIPGGSNVDNYPFMEPSGWEQVSGPVHNLDKDTYYDTIQAAIDDANPSDTIEVSNGTYYENVIINKTITLMGEDRNNTIIDGNGTGDVIYISACWVNVSGFGVRNSGGNWEDAGIELQSAWNNIINCLIHNNHYFGIYLYYSTNNTISGCIISNNTWYGIYFSYSPDNIVKECYVSSSYRGICYYESSDNKVTKCTVSNSSYSGIEPRYSSHITIEYCEIYSNVWGINFNVYVDNITVVGCSLSLNNGAAIIMSSGTSNNSILNCVMLENGDGILTWTSSNANIENCSIIGGCHGIITGSTEGPATNIIVTGCRISSCNYGIYFYSFYSNITMCTITNNTLGLYFSSSYYNYVYHNNFINNGQNAYDPYTNYWDDGVSEGNHWDDYTGSDNNGDGIGDTPYSISGGANTDNYPLMHEIIFSDKEMPNISLISPENNSIIKPGTVIGFNITDDNLWNASYYVNNGAVQFFSSDYNITTEGWEDGTYNITVYAKDWGMNEISKIFAFTIDGILPNISLVSPENNSVIKPGRVIDFEINDVHLNITTYTLNDAMPQTLSFPYNISTEGWEDGTYNITIWVDDLAGNEISQLFVFTIDGTQPNINITGVINGEYYNTNVTPFIDINDAHLNISENIIMLCNVSFISGETVSSEGKHTLYIYGVDMAGNDASQTISFTIDKTEPRITVTGVADKGYYNFNVTPNVNVYDENIDTISIQLNGEDFVSRTTVTEGGEYLLVVQAVDKAGNNVEKTVSFIIDKTKPVIDVTGVEDNVYYNVDVVPMINITDVYPDTSMLTLNSEIFVNGTTIANDGSYTLYVGAVDAAGNTANKTVMFVVDKTSPVINVVGVIDGAYYNANNLTFRVEILDVYLQESSAKLNGIGFDPDAIMMVIAEGRYTLIVSATDMADNTATETITFTVDRTVPIVTIAEYSRTTNKNSFTMHWTTTEEIQYYEISIDSSSWINIGNATSYMFPLSKGGNTLYVRGTDNAGNKGTDMITVTYKEEKPSIIPGFESLTILMILVACAILTRRKLLK